MAKRSPAPTKSTDEFIAWVAKTVPDDVWVRASVEHAYHREQGRRYQTFRVHLDLSHDKESVSQSSHDLTCLARWVLEVAIPVLFPPARRPLRKLTVESKKLAYRPIEPLFD